MELKKITATHLGGGTLSVAVESEDNTFYQTWNVESETVALALESAIEHVDANDSMVILSTVGKQESGTRLVQDVGIEGFGDVISGIGKKLSGLFSSKGKGFSYPERGKKAKEFTSELNARLNATLLNDSWLQKNVTGGKVSCEIESVADAPSSLDELKSTVDKLLSDFKKLADVCRQTHDNIRAATGRIDAFYGSIIKKYDGDKERVGEDTTLLPFIEKELAKLSSGKSPLSFYTPKYTCPLGCTYTTKKRSNGKFKNLDVVTSDRFSKKTMSIEIDANGAKYVGSMLKENNDVVIAVGYFVIGEHWDEYDYLAGEWYDVQAHALDLWWDDVYIDYWDDVANPILEAALNIQNGLIALASNIGK